jgi:hypothetical protein
VRAAEDHEEKTFLDQVGLAQKVDFKNYKMKPKTSLAP